MNRRAVITGASLLLVPVAGCLGDGLPALGPEPGAPDAQLVEVEPDPVSEALPLRHTIDLVHPDIRDPETPLTLRATIENTTGDSVEYGERRAVLFIHAHDQDFLLLRHEDERFGWDADLGLWRATDRIDHPADYQWGELDPGDRHHEHLVLTATETIQPPGNVPETLRFEASVSVQHPDEAWVRYQWGFTLTQPED